MISIENREAFAKAEAKARAIKPHVSVVKFGEYRVAASSGRDFYTVKFTRTTTGHWVASCTCPAHVADGRPDYPPKPCYHIPSAYSVHAAQVFKRQQGREEQHPLPKCDCGKQGFALYHDHWYCIDCIKSAMRDGLVDLGELDEARTWEKTQQAADDEADRDAVREMLERDRQDLFG
jgi:hypothetical protein